MEVSFVLESGRRHRHMGFHHSARERERERERETRDTKWKGHCNNKQQQVTTNTYSDWLTLFLSHTHSSSSTSTSTHKNTSSILTQRAKHSVIVTINKLHQKQLIINCIMSTHTYTYTLTDSGRLMACMEKFVASERANRVTAGTKKGWTSKSSKEPAENQFSRLIDAHQSKRLKVNEGGN